MKGLLPAILFRKYDKRIRSNRISTSTDTVLNIFSHSEYERAGVLCGSELKTYKSNPSIFHCMDKCSPKQLQICHSPYEASILACTVRDN